MGVLPSDAVKKLQAFTDGDDVTTPGKFTIADEKVRCRLSFFFL